MSQGDLKPSLLSFSAPSRVGTVLGAWPSRTRAGSLDADGAQGQCGSGQDGWHSGRRGHDRYSSLRPGAAPAGCVWAWEPRVCEVSPT